MARGSRLKTVIEDLVDKAKDDVNANPEGITDADREAFEQWMFRLPDDLCEKVGALNTWKQRLYCYHYARTLNATRSAILAGYALATASQKGYDLKKQELKDIIPALVAWAKNPKITRAELVEKLLEIYEKAMNPEGEDKEGKRPKPDLTIANRCISEIGKLSGFDKDRPDKPEDKMGSDLEFAFS